MGREGFCIIDYQTTFETAAVRDFQTFLTAAYSYLAITTDAPIGRSPFFSMLLRRIKTY